jgi:hypothetical protein
MPGRQELEQTMRTDKAGAARHQNTCHIVVLPS